MTLKYNLPPDSYVYTSDSGYSNSEVFFLCLLKQFITYFKVSSDNPAIRVAEGHYSHSRDVEMLNTVLTMDCLYLLPLPPHTTHWLQRTGRSF
jgi:hypothetical protein